MPYSRVMLAVALAGSATILPDSISTATDEQFTDWSVAINLETAPGTHPPEYRVARRLSSGVEERPESIHGE